MEGEHWDNCDECDSREGVNDKRCCSINRYMFPTKVAFFLKAARIHMDMFFLLFFSSLGLTPADASLINGFMYIGGFFGAPFWGCIADKFRIHRMLLLVLCPMSLITICSLPLLGITFGDKQRMSCPYNATLQHSAHTFNISGNHDKLFYSLLFIATVGLSFDAGVSSFVDGGCLHRVAMSPTVADIGKQRYIGVLGAVIADIMYSGAIMYYPAGKASCETGIFLVYFGIMVALGVCSYYLLKGITVGRQERNTDRTFAKDLFTTLKDYDHLFFFTSVILSGVMHAFFYSFINLHLKELNAIPLIYSMRTVVAGLSGGLVYYFSDYIIAMLGGNVNAICFSCFGWLIRFLWVSYIRNPYLVCFIGLTNGLSYSLNNIASLKHVDEISGASTLTTMCAIRNCFYNQLSIVIANFIGGQLYNKYGGGVLFRMLSVACGIWGGVMLCYILLAKRFYKGDDKMLKMVDAEETDDRHDQIVRDATRYYEILREVRHDDT